MVEKGFISEVTNYERIRLGPTEDYFLNEIGMSGSETAWSIFKSLEKVKNQRPPEWVKSKWPTVSPIAYKNVHRRIKKLESLGLIEKIPGKQFLHKAIRYRLTTRGLFQCLQKQVMSATLVVTDRGDRYKKNILMTTILYQFFEVGTIRRFDSEPRLLSLGKYLQSCSEAILSRVEEFKSSTFKEKKKWFIDDMDGIIEQEIRKFVFEIVTNLQTEEISLSRFDNDDKEYTRHAINLRLNIAPYKTLYPTFALAKDQKFLKILNEIKKDFDDAYKEFASFSSV